jgi:hypothetical protein
VLGKLFYDLISRQKMYTLVFNITYVIIERLQFAVTKSNFPSVSCTGRQFKDVFLRVILVNII